MIGVQGVRVSFSFSRETPLNDIGGGSLLSRRWIGVPSVIDPETLRSVWTGLFFDLIRGVRFRGFCESASWGFRFQRTVEYTKRSILYEKRKNSQNFSSS